MFVDKKNISVQSLHKYCVDLPLHTVLTTIVAVTLQYVYLCCIIELFQHNTPRLIYFEGLET